jgi:hypothetical protein
MSAKKLGRLAGFAFVLVALFGGVSTASAANAVGDSAAVASTAASIFQRDVVWT